jgi:hypothetical protein
MLEPWFLLLHPYASHYTDCAIPGRYSVLLACLFLHVRFVGTVEKKERVTERYE